MELNLNDLLTPVLVTLSVIGQGALLGIGIVLVIQISRRWIEPEPEPPKRKWTVNFTDPDGRPMLGYMMEEQAAYRLMNQAQHEYDNRFR